MVVRADAGRKEKAIEDLRDIVKTLRGHNAALRREVDGLKGTAKKASERHGGGSSSLGAVSNATESGVRLTKQKKRSLLWQPPRHHIAHSGLWSM
jgi:hypothetical protein